MSALLAPASAAPITLGGVVHPVLCAHLGTIAQAIMASRPRDQQIDRKDGGEALPYIERWYLARKAMVPGNSPQGHFLDQVPLIPSELENLYLHRYGRGDREEPHCHPWPNATLVISGSIAEDVWVDGVMIGNRRRFPGDVVLRQSHHVHAITAVSPGTITLFATLPKEREWGFHTEEGFIPWADFRAWKQAREAA